MDTAAIDAAGAKPIAPLLELASTAELQNLGTVVAQLQNQGVHPFFDFGPTPDFKNSTQNIADLSQGGLGLPDRDYYLRTDPKSKALLAAYEAHVATMFQLLGDAPATAAAEAASVVSFETALAKNQLSIVAQRDPANVYHKMPIAAVETDAPALRFGEYLSRTDVASGVPVNLEEPAYFKALSGLIGSMPASQTARVLALARRACVCGRAFQTV